MMVILKKICFSLLIIAILALSSGCSKDDAPEIIYESTATVIGPDFGLCPCCGGWVLTIENDSTIYRTETIDEKWFEPFDEDEFPMNINLNWTLNRICGGLNYIDIDEYEYK